jgi:hypothetical protein
MGKKNPPTSAAEKAYEVWAAIVALGGDPQDHAFDDSDDFLPGLLVKADLKTVMGGLWKMPANEATAKNTVQRVRDYFKANNIAVNVINGRANPENSQWWVAAEWPKSSVWQPPTTTIIEEAPVLEHPEVPVEVVTTMDRETGSIQLFAEPIDKEPAFPTFPSDPDAELDELEARVRDVSTSMRQRLKDMSADYDTLRDGLTQIYGMAAHLLGIDTPILPPGIGHDSRVPLNTEEHTE